MNIKSLQINEKKSNQISNDTSNNNTKIECSNKDSSTLLENQSNNFFINLFGNNNPLVSYTNFLDNYNIMQYQNNINPRLSFNNIYQLNTYKTIFNDLYDRINNNNYLQNYNYFNNYIYNIPRIPDIKINTNYINDNLFFPNFILNYNNNINTINNYYPIDISMIETNDINIDIKDNNKSKENSELNVNLLNNNIIEGSNNEAKKYIPKKKKLKTLFKLYDKDKNLIQKKRGKKAIKTRRITHTALDDDNILRKIQVHFLTFLVSITNDYIDTIFPEMKKKDVLHFKNLDYKIKKVINYESIEKMKNTTVGEILQKQASPKNKACEGNINRIIYIKLCEKCPELKFNYFNKLFKEFFMEYYYNKNERVILLNGVSINLSNRTQGFNELVMKNTNSSKKIRSMASYFFVNTLNNQDKQENIGEKEKGQIINRQKPLFIID